MAEISLVRKVGSEKISRKIVREVREKPKVTESSPVGMFDSGVGGLTVFEQIKRNLPKESIIYLADTARVPYGGRSASEIIKINNEIIPYLISLGAKIIVMACGTSSAIAYPAVKDKYNIPIIAIIEGGAKMAASATKNKKVGIIATVGTINSQAYQKSIKNIDKEIEAIGVACPLLVPLIEGGFAGSAETGKVLKEYLKPLIRARIDTLILGCTHYPHLKNTITSILGNDVVLIDPAEEAARAAKDTLAKMKMLQSGKANPQHRFLVTGSGNSFKELGSRLLGKPLQNVEEVALSSIKYRGLP